MNRQHPQTDRCLPFSLLSPPHPHEIVAQSSLRIDDIIRMEAATTRVSIGFNTSPLHALPSPPFYISRDEGSRSFACHCQLANFAESRLRLWSKDFCPFPQRPTPLSLQASPLSAAHASNARGLAQGSRAGLACTLVGRCEETMVPAFRIFLFSPSPILSSCLHATRQASCHYHLWHAKYFLFTINRYTISEHATLSSIHGKIPLNENCCKS